MVDEKCKEILEEFTNLNEEIVLQICEMTATSLGRQELLSKPQQWSFN
jgi:hypothetical protein